MINRFEEFNLDKNTIELGKTFDRETELIGSNLT